MCARAIGAFVCLYVCLSLTRDSPNQICYNPLEKPIQYVTKLWEFCPLGVRYSLAETVMLADTQN